ncbi:23S rRNA (uracil(1939)-C(5))-methyltransferase RlmD [soil metagenome]
MKASFDESANPTVDIESLDLEARGIAHLPAVDPLARGKVVFIEGALQGERVRFKTLRRKSNYEVGQMTVLERASASRVEPRCPHFGTCGGCSMQHLHPAAQIAVKQRVLEDNLWHIARLRPEVVLRPVQGPDWHYRFRARFSVRFVFKRGGVLVGFHERKSTFIADIGECHVVPPHVSALLLPLRELIGSLSIRERLPQIEYAQGEGVTALVLRVLDTPSSEDEAALRAFADRWGVQFWLQSKGPETAVPFHPLDLPELSYTLPEFQLRMPFKPTDFTQVNHRINRVLVSLAVARLDCQPGDRVLDLFCGLGNFTLPLARRAASVLGVEGSATLLERARRNAGENGLSNVAFEVANLFEVSEERFAAWGAFDRVLIDPPREGAMQIAKLVSAAPVKPRRLVYVSCNPATLARDANVLVNEGGFRLSSAGIVNMFPHTSHIESMAVFDHAGQ